MLKRTLSVLLGALCIVLLAVFYSVIRPAETAEDAPMETESPTYENQYNPEGATTLAFSEDGISVTGPGVSIENRRATIVYPGTYRLVGSASDAGLIVNCEYDGVVYLILDNVDITCPDGPAVYVRQADKTVLVLPDNTQSVLQDGESYQTFSVPEGKSQPEGAIYSCDDLSLCGSGCLTVLGQYAHGICCRDGLELEDCSVTVDAVSDGIHVKEAAVLQSVYVTITAGEDGIQSYGTDTMEGCIQIQESLVSILADGDAIAAANDLQLSNTELTASTAGGFENYKAIALYDYSAKGLKADSITLDDSTVLLDTADDSIHAGNLVSIMNTAVQVSSGDEGIQCDGAVIFDGGELWITESYEGIRAADLQLANIRLMIASEDDAITQTAEQGRCVFDIGCEVSITSGGCCCRTAGTLCLYGGTVYASSNSEHHAMLDIASAEYRDGAAIFTGMGDWTEPNPVPTVSSFYYAGADSFAANAEISLYDAAGPVIEYKAPQPFRQLVILAGEGQNNNYTLQINGESIASNDGGYGSDEPASAEASEEPTDESM